MVGIHFSHRASASRCAWVLRRRQCESRTAPEAFHATYASPSLRMSRGNEKHRNLAAEWHTEVSVQASLVTALAAEGWRILSVSMNCLS